MKTKRDLTEQEKQFIRDHFKDMPIRELTAKLKRASNTIYAFVKSENIMVVDGSRRSTRHHPWRKANHQMGLYTMTDKPKTQCGRDKK
jgi:hypothetical protein